MSDPPRPSPFLLVGEQRSGTTFLMQVLDRRPAVVVRPGLLSRVVTRAWRWRLEVDAPLSRRRRRALLDALRAHWEPDPDAPPLDVGPCDFGSLAELLDVAMARAAPGARLSGHKLHGPAPMLATLLRVPGLRAVYLVRDARDAMLSRRRRGDGMLDSHVIRWRRAARCIGALRGHPRLHVLRFEDLVRDPRAELSRLRAFLGTAPEPGDIAIERSRFNTSFGDLAVPFDRRAAARWLDARRDPLVRFTAWACRRELMSLGYDPDHADALPPRERRRFAARLARARALHAAARSRDALERLALR